MLSKQDQEALELRGISGDAFHLQIDQLQKGIPPLPLLRPCTLHDGIIPLGSSERTRNEELFYLAHNAGRISKFIPASGAATRMFKDLIQFLQHPKSTSPWEQPTDSLPDFLQTTLTHFKKFPFYPQLFDYFQHQDHDLEALYQGQDFPKIFSTLLYSPGLDFADYPKALLPFHRYQHTTRTALEEHLYEAMTYRPQRSGKLLFHITVSPQFEYRIQEALNRFVTQTKSRSLEWHCTVSTQHPSTDTICLDEEGQPFRVQGDLLFRPGGHGALLRNLQQSKGDIVMISNIDNVVPDYLKPLIIDTRIQLTGLLLHYQMQTYHHLNVLSQNSQVPGTLEKAEHFIQDELHLPLPDTFHTLNKQVRTSKVFEILNRPIRVCGMVPNSGDPGGGPFWVSDANGNVSRQIVEQSQVDSQSKQQRALFESATHFNPVDMVCGIRDHSGLPFTLSAFTDPSAGFVSQKSFEGKSLKALEWPGLWNGGMANWITIFVEIPGSTFNPVKTYLDWLHPNHQPQHHTL